MAAARDQAARIVRSEPEMAGDAMARDASADLGEQARADEAKSPAEAPPAAAPEQPAASPATAAPKSGKRRFVLMGIVGLLALAGRRADALNEGARKLADIAMAVALRPRLLLMDEPTSGVAAAEKMAVVEVLARVLREAGVTAVFVEHDMEVVARFADRVAVWNRGRIAALGPPGTVLADPEVRREVIGAVAVPGAGMAHAAA